MDRILVPTAEVAEAGWNKYLPVPLRSREKVIVLSDQTGVTKGFIRIKHGEKDHKVISVFGKTDFVNLQGKRIS